MTDTARQAQWMTKREIVFSKIDGSRRWRGEAGLISAANMTVLCLLDMFALLTHLEK